jgi:protocatechuate 3,4-dioxygenase beta subunit
MTDPKTDGSRRTFLKSVGIFSGVVAAARAAASNDDPFDALSPGVWRNSRMNGLVMIRHPEPAGLTPRAKIVRPGEPGEPLVATGQVFEPDCKTPVAGATVYAYNTDAQGYYGENRREYPPRIYGWMKTDNIGHFELLTIKPGRYPGMHVPAHIHFSLWGGGYPPQWVDELRFDGDSYLTPDMLAQDRTRGGFATIRRLTRNSDGVLHCSFAIRLQHESNFSEG